MADWLVERGIGETRMVRVRGDEIVEARIRIDGVVEAGTVLKAKLKRTGRPAIATVEGAEYLLPHGAPGVTEGASLSIEVTRETIPGTEPWKRPLAKVTGDVPGALARDDSETLPFPAPADRLAGLGWYDLLDQARSGIVRFAGGELRVSPTPAMTLIDVDGTLPPLDLARGGATAAARTIVRHGIGGSIGVDLPTVAGKAERLSIAEAVDAALPQPFERTAVNGFGFLQIVRPRRHASLFELASDRAPFEARALLRRVASTEAGPKRLVGSPPVIAVLAANPDWTDTLARQLAGAVALRADAALAMSACYAEPV